jgi:hypothetical protein
MAKRFGLTTDRAGDLKAAVYGLSGAIVIMEPGWDKTFLLGLFMITMMVISWLTVGNIPPEAAEELMVEKDIRDVLREGREDSE